MDAMVSPPKGWSGETPSEKDSQAKPKSGEPLTPKPGENMVASMRRRLAAQNAKPSPDADGPRTPQRGSGKQTPSESSTRSPCTPGVDTPSPTSPLPTTFVQLQTRVVDIDTRLWTAQRRLSELHGLATTVSGPQSEHDEPLHRLEEKLRAVQGALDDLNQRGGSGGAAGGDELKALHEKVIQIEEKLESMGRSGAREFERRLSKVEYEQSEHVASVEQRKTDIELKLRQDSHDHFSKVERRLQHLEHVQKDETAAEERAQACADERCQVLQQRFEAAHQQVEQKVEEGRGAQAVLVKRLDIVLEQQQQVESRVRDSHQMQPAHVKAQEKMLVARAQDMIKEAVGTAESSFLKAMQVEQVKIKAALEAAQSDRIAAIASEQASTGERCQSLERQLETSMQQADVKANAVDSRCQVLERRLDSMAMQAECQAKDTGQAQSFLEQRLEAMQQQFEAMHRRFDDQGKEYRQCQSRMELRLDSALAEQSEKSMEAVHQQAMERNQLRSGLEQRLEVLQQQAAESNRLRSGLEQRLECVQQQAHQAQAALEQHIAEMHEHAEEKMQRRCRELQSALEQRMGAMQDQADDKGRQLQSFFEQGLADSCQQQSALDQRVEAMQRKAEQEAEELHRMQSSLKALDAVSAEQSTMADNLQALRGQQEAARQERTEANVAEGQWKATQQEALEAVSAKHSAVAESLESLWDWQRTSRTPQQWQALEDALEGRLAERASGLEAMAMSARAAASQELRLLAEAQTAMQSEWTEVKALHSQSFAEHQLATSSSLKEVQERVDALQEETARGEKELQIVIGIIQNVQTQLAQNDATETLRESIEKMETDAAELQTNVATLKAEQAGVVVAVQSAVAEQLEEMAEQQDQQNAQSEKLYTELAANAERRAAARTELLREELAQEWAADAERQRKCNEEELSRKFGMLEGSVAKLQKVVGFGGEQVAQVSSLMGSSAPGTGCTGGLADCDDLCSRLTDLAQQVDEHQRIIQKGPAAPASDKSALAADVRVLAHTIAAGEAAMDAVASHLLASMTGNPAGTDSRPGNACAAAQLPSGLDLKGLAECVSATQAAVTSLAPRLQLVAGPNEGELVGAAGAGTIAHQPAAPPAARQNQFAAPRAADAAASFSGGEPRLLDAAATKFTSFADRYISPAAEAAAGRELKWWWRKPAA